MFYIKTEQGEIPIEEIYTRCFHCRKEIEVSSEMLIDILKDGDIFSTQVACCSYDLRPSLKRIK